MTKRANHRIDAADIRAALAGRAAELARDLLGEPNAVMSSKTELRFGRRGSLSVDLVNGCWYDHEIEKGGDLIALIQRERRCDFTAALTFAHDFVGSNVRAAPAPSKPNGKAPAGDEVATYDYRDEDGALLFQVVRYEPKDFRQRRPDPKRRGKWIWSTKAVRPVPYKLPELRASLEQHRMVVVVEGERDADNLCKLGIPATTNPGGAGKWRDELSGFFRGADVVIIPDRDPQKVHQKTGELMFHPDGRPILPGQDHAEMVARSLHGVAKRVRVLELWRSWPDMPVKGDVSDWLANGGSAEALNALIERTPDWPPPEGGTDAEQAEPEDESATDAEIARLARLTVCDYEQQRKPAAEALGFRASILDQLVQAKRTRLGLDDDDDTGMQGRPIKLVVPEPWPEPVDGPSHLNEIVKAIKTYMVLSDHAARSCAVWTVYTFLPEHFLVSPRLCISSPVMGCGKSTLTDIVSRLVSRPLKSSNATPAAIFRVVEMHKPCLLIDEGDTFVELSEELRGILNSGHRHDGAVLRVVGEQLEPRLFATFSPCSVALIGELPPTLADRSIPIGLKRRRPADGDVASFSLDNVGHLDLLARQSARWTQDHAVEIAAAKPQMPDGIINRARDNWLVLKALATVAGGEWPGYIDGAALAAQSRSGEETSQLERLLADIKAVAFLGDDEDEVRSADLVQRLIELEGRPWAEMTNDKPLTQNKLARLLKDVGVAPDYVGPENERARGYKRGQFNEAFERYLAPEGVSNCAGVQNPINTGTSCISEVCSPENGCTDEKCEKSANDGLLHTCTVEKGGSGQEHEVTFFGIEPFEPCEHCGKADRVVHHVRDNRHLDRPSVNLHEACVADWFACHDGDGDSAAVCDHCGRPGGNVVSISGRMLRLHRGCERPYLDDEGGE